MNIAIGTRLAVVCEVLGPVKDGEHYQGHELRNLGGNLYWAIIPGTDFKLLVCSDYDQTIKDSIAAAELLEYK